MSWRLLRASRGPQREPQFALSVSCSSWALAWRAACSRSASSSQDVALAFGSFAVASAIFLILELNQPFSEFFRVPSAPIEGHCRAGQIAQLSSVVTSQFAQADLIRSKRRAECLQFSAHRTAGVDVKRPLRIAAMNCRFRGSRPGITG